MERAIAKNKKTEMNANQSRDVKYASPVDDNPKGFVFSGWRVFDLIAGEGGSRAYYP